MFRRAFHTTTAKLASPVTARAVFQSSCFKSIDYQISENATTKDLVSHLTAFNIGCLAVTDNDNKVIGTVTERDFIRKIASLDLNPADTYVRDICTRGNQLIVARDTDSVQTCLSKLLVTDKRHLLIMDDKNECIGMISIKDLTRQVVKGNNETIARLSDFALGKGAFFGSE